jgi:hypothetical protein
MTVLIGDDRYQYQICTRREEKELVGQVRVCMCEGGDMMDQTRARLKYNTRLLTN